MAKIVKYCTACEEGFAEKFGFCPNCGLGLTAFEMNPVIADAVLEPTPTVSEVSFKLEAEEKSLATETLKTFEAPIIEVPIVAETVATNLDNLAFDDNHETIFEEELFSVEEPIEQITAPISLPISLPISIPAVASFTTKLQTPQVFQDEFLEKETYGYVKPNVVGEYNPTIVDTKGDGTREFLLMAAFVLVMSFAGGYWLYDLFAKNLDIAGLEEQGFVVAPVTDIVTDIEKEEILEKEKEKGGGGGGGGKQDAKDDVSKGEMARQTEKPEFTPSATMVRVTDPSLEIRVSTQGKTRNETIDPNQRYGAKNGQTSSISDGFGNGGGMGGGNGQGQGTGNGTGRGGGNGSGAGNGIGNGIGNGRGDAGGDGGEPPTRPPTPVKPKAPAVTSGVKITFQPKPPYTDAARQAAIQGVVVLKVTFSANGSIGSVSVVRGLSNGLTEQAIAAAKNIRFTPAMEDGVPKASSKTMQFSFTIY